MKKSQKVYLFFKRTFDIVGSFLSILVFFALFWWWIILINAFVTNGHPFTTEECLGKRRKHFKIVTFRTILPKDCLTLKANDADVKKGLETGFGRFLKKTKFVSMPKLLNVLIGNMSFVGPRPANINSEFLLVSEREKGHPNAYDIRPGLKGYALLKAGYSIEPEIEASYDTLYTKNINFFFDCKLLFASTKNLSRSTKNKENVTIVNEENAIITNEEEQIPAPETNKKKSISFFFVVFSFLAATLSSAFIFTGTTNYKLDKLAFNINNYNEHYYTEDFKRPFVKIEKNETNILYDDLFSRFYYSDDSGSVRQYMDNDSRIVINGSASNKVTLFSQSTFAIQNNIAADGGYRVDYGLFHAYFSDNELGGVRSYVGKHFNCDSYIFISDSVADMLLRHYNLPFDDDSKLDSYLKLIQDEKYAVLSLRVDNSMTLKFSINNILYSDKRTAPRCVEFNKYFGLINYMYVSKNFKPCFEIDFKSYSYYITSVLKDSNSLGYTTDNSKYDFYTYDYENNKYLLNQEVTARFKELPADFSINAFNVLFYCSIWVFGLIYLFLAIKSLNNKSDLLFCVFFEVLWLAMYSVLGNFFYTCFAFSIVPLLLLIVLLIAKGDLLLGSKRAKQNKESNLDK